ncbi:MAG: spore maturation protein [Clostridia bacterium]|nr:spore maturation protein [Clostridia bacterium]
MNLIFTVILLISIIFTAIINPNEVLSAMTEGAGKSVTLGINLLAIYAVWSGFLQIAEDSGLCEKLSKLLRPLIKLLFKPKNKDCENQIAINLSANLLGMGGIATPSGIDATKLLCDERNYDGACLLLIIASTSIQILPTTVVSIRQNFNSLSPFDIFLPSLLATVFSTTLGITLHFITKKWAKK